VRPDTNVEGWCAKTPSNFVFALKVPQLIAHEKVGVDCEGDQRILLNNVDRLDER